ncbi:NAD-dependent epimerase/dehydratase family protein [Desulforamulus hydrothermalis]|uniref:Putative UDP-glucose 4-epimerase n=1 Tax=Desulforamulus hydrothermalis Lam5 = DSM 18033 TaxID=1121428 RepID=K8EFY9_9FIRM|nr:NAD-dependent epimerase/dehydratase family protein [Desulforamulus hydrothermalis]CCO07611.1 putative UDP-glucose 4-epimerase [Desulforamulus hydrothermalis Lam5 = DSM 18033]SHH19938.1 UDP-glucose 4-epimerase [Desulforamulus hydrothermalis Lam5 = DSM 18033]
MRVLVTGGAGFIGSHVAEALLAAGHEVYVIDNLAGGSTANLPPGVTFCRQDITDPAVVGLVGEIKPRVIMHQAAQVAVPVSLRDPVFDAGVNIIGTLHLLEACRQHGVAKIVFASSAAVYGTPRCLPLDESHPAAPLSGYGVAKYAVEKYLAAYGELYGLRWTALRYANVYGPRQDAQGEGGVVAIFIDRLLRRQPAVIFGDGQQTRDFVYVKDVAAANLLAMERGDGRILNISTGRAVTVQQLYQLIRQQTASHLEPVYRPPRPGDIVHSYLDNRAAVACLGWQPRYDLADGLRETVAYYLNKKN